jgi:hypothetical protein
VSQAPHSYTEEEEVWAMVRAFHGGKDDAELVQRFGYGLELEIAAMKAAREALLELRSAGPSGEVTNDAQDLANAIESASIRVFGGPVVGQWQLSDDGRALIVAALRTFGGRDAKDAARYCWLKSRLHGADFQYPPLEGDGWALIFRMPEFSRISADLDESLDLMMKRLDATTNGVEK